MAAWKRLPDTLDHRDQQLVVQLRRLKDRSGLSLASLAAKTAYSRSSWERYLNGRAVPPRQAVEALAHVAGTDPARLLVLHEVAARAREERAAPSLSPGVGEGGEQEAVNAVGAVRPAEVRGSVVLAAVVAAALVGLGAGMLIVSSWPRHEGTGGSARTAVSSPHPGSTAAGGPGPYVYKLGKTYPCEVTRAHGKQGGLEAGYSATRTAILAGPGWNVVEAQCLLRYHKMDPGAVDGVYGQQTIAAVARLQEKAGLPVDGVAGPDTWRVLRR
ncbi:helix-turn-helix domain-containing protein [Streptomyces sp. NRRL F-5126]|uniref:helix-turn-helix domain-containing protein n=1 Tax=Streptomyces sp. NRRL F-5126 TaxID=1463857 RepID=UPI0004C8151A|nr:helix-turn-helix domain-containing protein [Streptomyces sp. NRRL F-5126]